MKNRCLLFVALLVTMLCSAHRVMAQGSSVTIDGITYSLYAGGGIACVVDAADTITHAKVKSEVTLDGMVYPVTRIVSSAFSSMDGNLLQTIELPNTINAIESYAFSNCTNLTSIDILDGLTFIGSYAFQNCTSLSSINIPEGVTRIEEYTFSGCTSLTSLKLPNGLTSIANFAFYVGAEDANPHKGGLRDLELPASIQSIGYNAFPPSLSKLTCNSVTPPAIGTNPWGGTDVYTLGNVSIVYVPAGCKSAYKSVYPWSSKVILDGAGVSVSVNVSVPGMMGEEILNQTEYLSDVNHLIVSGKLNSADIDNIKNSMPNLLTIDMLGVNMTVLPEDMFYNRKALLSIVLPNSLERISGGAFYNCINLESIVIPEGVTTISNDNEGAFSNCSSLKSVSFPTTLKAIGNYAFLNCPLLNNVVLKEGVTSIGEYAFSNCRSLSNITLPKGLTYIGGYAFMNCTTLRNIELKEGLTSLGQYYEWEGGSYIFSGCTSLENVVFPSTLTTIGNYVFQNCTKLTTLIIPEGISAIGVEAFSGCTSLKEVVLPSTLTRCASNPFRGCNKLGKVTCMALIPPTLYNGLLSLEDMGLALKRTLYVPEWTLNKYKLTSGWAAFAEILPIKSSYPSVISVDQTVTLSLPTGGLPAGYKPDLYIEQGYNGGGEMMSSNAVGNLYLKGTGDVSLNTFKMYQFRYNQYSDYSSDWWGYDLASVFLTEPTVLAESVMTNLSLSSGHWHFLSFPYDVKVSDIQTSGDWVIRYYDGEARAKMDYNNTWVTVPYDGILRAGQGYIWSSSNGNFTVPAMNNANKNLIFANTTRNIPLVEYASNSTSNSSWNLIGNPFPTYYDTRFMEYTAPITVWDRKNRTYVAYSPVDDDYILTPLEAFFVQCPAGVTEAGFKAEGRQTTTEVRSLTTPVAVATRSAKASREVFNLQLSDGQRNDRTRFVINDDALMMYEVGCDAAKFMSTDAKAPQLFSLVGEDKMAINERPMADGRIALGVYFGEAGTYTISLETSTDTKVTLIDHFTGTEHDMAMGEYAFETETGTFVDRFTVVLSRTGVTAVDEAVVQNKVSVTAVEGGIVVSTIEASDIALYTVSGVQMAEANGTVAKFAVTPGLYVVKVGGTSYKVSVVK